MIRIKVGRKDRGRGRTVATSCRYVARSNNGNRKVTSTEGQSRDTGGGGNVGSGPTSGGIKASWQSD
jgi:hypothetical protein